MKVKHTAHRRNSMIGKVVDIPDDEAFQLIQAGYAVAVDDIPAAVPAASQAAGDASAPKAAVAKPTKD